ncbi:hypothetical protein CLF_100445 [Clonorchis sinensis]|uniref:Uncharacterized protein n=1 Tax=Clonorchis sinensis TaxID=79923 RepID=G7Y3G7_CLOSI|nr:hypothetical protein CLF_100445 [Clonorchis sinensis]
MGYFYHDIVPGFNWVRSCSPDILQMDVQVGGLRTMACSTLNPCLPLVDDVAYNADIVFGPHPYGFDLDVYGYDCQRFGTQVLATEKYRDIEVYTSKTGDGVTPSL